MVVGIGGIGGSRVGGQRCAGSPRPPSGRSSPPCANADDFAASEADHDGATCSNSAVAAIRNRRGCMPHLQVEQNYTLPDGTGEAEAKDFAENILNELGAA